MVTNLNYKVRFWHCMFFIHKINCFFFIANQRNWNKCTTRKFEINVFWNCCLFTSNGSKYKIGVANDAFCLNLKLEHHKNKHFLLDYIAYFMILFQWTKFSCPIAFAKKFKNKIRNTMHAELRWRFKIGKSSKIDSDKKYISMKISNR